MGRYTNLAVAPFVRRGPDVTRFIQYLYSLYTQDPLDELITPVVYNGWKYYCDSAEKFKDKNGNTLLCDTIEKDNFKLYIINESQYASGGDEAYCIFSTRELDMLRLCEDVELFSNRIKFNDAIQQTL